MKFKKSFYSCILSWTGCLMIPLPTLYEEYIDQAKLTDEKNTFEYIVPPHSRGFGIKKQLSEANFAALDYMQPN